MQSALNERLRRLLVAAEAKVLGRDCVTDNVLVFQHSVGY